MSLPGRRWLGGTVERHPIEQFLVLPVWAALAGGIGGIEMVCGLLHFLDISIKGKITAASLCDGQEDFGRRR
jgi:hypothetical protein